MTLEKNTRAKNLAVLIGLLVLIALLFAVTLVKIAVQ
jgi:hypothetical protein